MCLFIHLCANGKNFVLVRVEKSWYLVFNIFTASKKKCSSDMVPVSGDWITSQPDSSMQNFIACTIKCFKFDLMSGTLYSKLLPYLIIDFSKMMLMTELLSLPEKLWQQLTEVSHSFQMRHCRLSLLEQTLLCSQVRWILHLPAYSHQMAYALYVTPYTFFAFHMPLKAVHIKLLVCFSDGLHNVIVLVTVTLLHMHRVREVN